MPITVEKGHCPMTSRTVYSLYDGDFPVVPATIFLRHLDANAGLTANTLAASAYALSSFFDFLERNDISFWKITQATIKSYKRFHLGRRDQRGAYEIKRQTARQYLNVIKNFIGYWRGLREDDPLFIDHVSELDGVRVRNRRRGALSHISWYSRVPSSLWQIKVPTEERHSKPRYKGLSVEQGRQVMDVLNRAEHRTDLETMLYYRDRAIWAYMLMSLERKGEVVRTRLEDLDQRRGMIYLVDRLEDRWLGALKSGPGEIFVTSNNPYWSAVNSWLTEGRWIAEKILSANGRRDHGMLFCNRDGGPLTQAAIDHLFRRLKKACKFWLFYPHITRHTTACMMLDAGVDMKEVQTQLRHVSSTSTTIYAKVSVQKLRASMNNFWREVSL
jgi:site-specific recombinase XerD